MPNWVTNRLKVTNISNEELKGLVSLVLLGDRDFSLNKIVPVNSDLYKASASSDEPECIMFWVSIMQVYLAYSKYKVIEDYIDIGMLQESIGVYNKFCSLIFDVYKEDGLNNEEAEQEFRQILKGNIDELEVKGARLDKLFRILGFTNMFTSKDIIKKKIEKANNTFDFVLSTILYSKNLNHTIIIDNNMSISDVFSRGLLYISNLLTYGESTWYEYCIKHWGTKWDTDVSYYSDEGEWAFTTAWSPPIEALCTLSQKYPTALFTLDYIDEGLNFLGRSEIQNGKETEIELTEEESKEIKLQLYGEDDEEDIEDDTDYTVEEVLTLKNKDDELHTKPDGMIIKKSD